MTVEQGERNQFVFDYARLRRTGTVAQAAAHANSLCAPPLPAAEVAGIIRSIERYEARQRTRNGLRGRGHGHLSDAYRRRQAERGRIGGSRGTAAQRAQRVTAAQRAAHVRAQKAAARATEARQQAAGSEFDKSDPANISPFVAYLATADCPIAGKVFFVWANEVRLFQPWTIIDTVSTDGRWTIEGLEQAAAKWGDVTFDQSLGIS